jgi:hypothetical protein
MATRKTTNPLAAVGEVISVGAIDKAPRGKPKAVAEPGLVAAFAALPEGQAVKLTTRFGVVAKADQAAAATIIRRAWDATGRADRAAIDWGTSFVPTVSAKARKGTAPAPTTAG